MKYANKLTNQEIVEYYKNNLLEPESKIKEYKITKTFKKESCHIHVCRVVS